MESSNSMEFWMTNLPERIKELSIIYLAIPGSHDSMSYGIKTRAPVAPDASESIHTLNKIIPCVVKRWAVTQKYCVTMQLLNGIRYFDLRFSLNPSDSEFYFVHGLYCEKILSPLNELKEYLDAHPQEIVILDCQHFYNFSKSDHVNLSNILTTLFSNKLYTQGDGSLLNCTLNKMKELQKQIIIIYRSDIGFNYTSFWQSYQWPTPWPNQVKISKLENYLSESIGQRPYGAGYVTQCVLTPTIDYIIPRFISSLRRSCAYKVDKQLSKWISAQSPGQYNDGESPKFNVFLADFVDIQNSSFCKLVIDLNSKI